MEETYRVAKGSCAEARRRGNEAFESCTIIDGPANEQFGKIHDRIMFALSPDLAERLLDRKLTDAGKAMDLLQPNPEDSIVFHRLSTRVINKMNQGE